MTRKKDALPLTIGGLGEHELHVQCDRCGRLHRLYPGHAAHAPGLRLTTLLARLECTARRGGDACSGPARRLVLIREERRWVLEPGGGWVEDESSFWESADFIPRETRR
jgi:hypothetical protein